MAHAPGGHADRGSPPAPPLPGEGSQATTRFGRGRAAGDRGGVDRAVGHRRGRRATRSGVALGVGTRATVGGRRRARSRIGAGARAVGAVARGDAAARHAHDHHDLRPRGPDDQRHSIATWPSHPTGRTSSTSATTARSSSSARSTRSNRWRSPAASPCGGHSSRRMVSGSASSTARHAQEGRDHGRPADHARQPRRRLHAARRGLPTTRSSSRPTTRRRGCSACRPQGGRPRC